VVEEFEEVAAGEGERARVAIDQRQVLVGHVPDERLDAGKERSTSARYWMLPLAITGIVTAFLSTNDNSRPILFRPSADPVGIGRPFRNWVWNSLVSGKNVLEDIARDGAGIESGRGRKQLERIQSENGRFLFKTDNETEL